MKINGRALARSITAEIREELAAESLSLRVTAITISPDKATESYLSIKRKKALEAGMELVITELPETSTTEEVIEAIEKDTSHALLVQLPLPAHIDSGAVVNAIPLAKDADVLSVSASEKFYTGSTDAVLPPVVAAVSEICRSENIELTKKKIYVLGKGKLVGAPVIAWLTRIGADVKSLDKTISDLSVLQDADIIIAGAGVPHIIKKEHVRDGTVLIDAGTSESDGAVVGDIDPECYEKASFYTPVPGGVGPVAVACLFKNVLLLSRKH